jgi:Tfp pilus assembly protein PilE
MRLAKNQKGFGLIEILLLVIALTLIAAVGFYVYKTNQAEDQEQAQTAVSTEAQTDETEPDPTSDWVAYTDNAGYFSLKYPSNWITAENPEDCSKGILLLGADKDSVGKCATESFGQISVYSNPGNLLADTELDAEHYPDLQTKTVTIDGVEGKRQTGTYQKTASDDDFGFGPSEGDKTTKYTFFTNNRTFSLNYSNPVGSSYPDVIEDFDLMATETFKFL